MWSFDYEDGKIYLFLLSECRDCGVLMLMRCMAVEMFLSCCFSVTGCVATDFLLVPFVLFFEVPLGFSIV